ncbi:SDR family oxidoreductase [Caldimonas brevitalea]|uniref:3-oxoacyl-[acyl-carrier protein] reductase n=1 Tax=Caldimonas brevitalea TaxID=413882 RepID=A0A0G3BR55_9BURK|nr:SDR family oxidoreductase [Caldimonas brevitalea]AKJ31904.1 3-oxoacyl-[acyl-carrier protein] reductase [Caldimonas brevitalea]
MSPYAGKNVIVIGGTHGMGRATAEILAEAGARVLITGHNQENVDRAQAELAGRATVLRSNVASLADIDVLARRVRESGTPVDALFVFAATAAFESFDQVREDSYDQHFGINTKGAFFTVQRLAPCMADGGSITMTTVTPAPANPGMSVYLGTKAAVTAFVRSFAAELLPRRIRVNAVAPGFIDTPTLGLAGLTPEQRAEVSALGDAITPMQRHGNMIEVARAALFLGFDATFTTGVELAVDGGLSTVAVPG